MISRGKVCEKVKAAAFIAFEVVGADVGGILVVFFTVVLVEAGRAVVRVAEDGLSADAVEDTPLDSPVLCVRGRRSGGGSGGRLRLCTGSQGSRKHYREKNGYSPFDQFDSYLSLINLHHADK